MSEPPHTKNELKEELQRIKSKGFIKSLRKNNTGIGFTLEEELHIRENNLKVHDLTLDGENVELKSKRIGSGSRLTVFTLEPHKELNDKELIQKYGYVDSEGRPALKVTITLGEYNPKGFKLGLSEDGRNLSIVHRDGSSVWAWDLETLFVKFENLLMVFAKAKKAGDAEYFHYLEATLYENLKREVFFGFLQEKKLVVDLRMHLKPTGAVRNRGTGFRINPKYIPLCYASESKIL